VQEPPISQVWQVLPSGAAFVATMHSGTPIKPAKVLVVDDDRFLRKALTYVLCRHGYDVIEACDGEEGLSIIRDVHPDLVYLDVVMPKMGGPALAKRLLARQPSLKVVFISGYADEAIGDRRMLEEGASFLQKPFTLDALLLKVRRVLDEARRRSSETAC